jgi:hypothetical protein
MSADETRKSSAFDWLDNQCVNYGMGIRPYRKGIGLVALRYMSTRGEYVHTKSHDSLLECCEAAMFGEESEEEK